MFLFKKYRNTLFFKKVSLNGSQLMYSNIVLGHTLKDYNKNLSKYFIAVYNEQILINFFFLFSNLKKNLIFLLNLYLKKHNIFFFSSNFLTNKLYTKKIYTFEKIN